MLNPSPPYVPLQVPPVVVSARTNVTIAASALESATVKTAGKKMKRNTSSRHSLMRMTDLLSDERRHSLACISNWLEGPGNYRNVGALPDGVQVQAGVTLVVLVLLLFMGSPTMAALVAHPADHR